MGLDGVEIVIEVERDFGIKIADIEAQQSVRVTDVCEVVFKHLMGAPAELPARLKHLVFLHVQTIVSEQLAIRRSKVKPESRFGEDLGVD